MKPWAIIVAAGAGTRFGAPKQFETIGRQRMVDRAVDIARRHCVGVIVVLPAGTAWDGPSVDAAVVGGATRSASVRAGLDAVPEEADVIVVHDAARPLATDEVFGAVIDAVLAGADGAVPGLPVSDTIKRVSGAAVVETVPREDLIAVQTPQAFRATELRRAHATGAEGTDDAALIEALGGRVVVVAGDPANLKVTAADDLVRVRALVADEGVR